MALSLLLLAYSSTVVFNGELGSLGEWVSGIGALAAVGAALSISDREHRRAQQAIEDERTHIESERQRVESDRQREAARAVNLWVEIPSLRDQASWRLVLSNAGTEPIYEWAARSWYLDPQTGNTPYYRSVGYQTVGTLPPRHVIRVSITMQKEGVDPPNLPRPAQRFHTGMFWRDGKDAWWCRDEKGLLGPHEARDELPADAQTWAEDPMLPSWFASMGVVVERRSLD